MKQIPVICAIVLACGPSAVKTAEQSEATAASNGSAAKVEHGAFALLVRGDTTVKEEYTRTDAMLRGVVRPTLQRAKFGWASYEIEFAGNFVARARLDLGPAGSSTVSRSWLFTVRDGTVIEIGPDHRETQLDAGPDVIPVFPPSMVMFHEVIRRALPLRRALGSARIPVYHFPGDKGRVDSVTVAWTTRDTAAVSYNGPATHFGVARDGRILGSRPDDFTYVRIR